MINKQKLYAELKELAKTGPLKVTVSGVPGTRRHLVHDVVEYVLNGVGGFNVGINGAVDDSSVSFIITADTSVKPKRKGRPAGAAAPTKRCTSCDCSLPTATKTCFNCGMILIF
ncbi:hypothetical protein [Xanthomonas phage XAJ2]|uniref:Uncharacterized protein n=1 Tax=Xanthomonas phage XAJ2 TaxID=1775249 RepID=A0A1I9L2H9_9CAUD|nr:hypothetical protein [Xanthomonas phage XAJ2]